MRKGSRVVVIEADCPPGFAILFSPDDAPAAYVPCQIVTHGGTATLDPLRVPGALTYQRYATEHEARAALRDGSTKH